MTDKDPNVFVEVGESDNWSIADRFGQPVNTHPKIDVDHTLRVFTQYGGAFDAYTIKGRKHVVPTTVPRYCEFELLATTQPGSLLVGLWRPTSIPESTNFYLDDGAATYDFAGGVRGAYGAGYGSAQTSIGMGLGFRIGLKFWKTSGGVMKAQFTYLGVNSGPELTVTTLSPGDPTEGRWLAARPATNGDKVAMVVDRDELHHLPADCVPWGSTIAVADADGYTRKSSTITHVGPSANDLYPGKKAVASSTTVYSQMLNDAPNLADAPGYYYYEVLVEKMFLGLTYGGLVGLSVRNAPTTVGYVGEIDQQWGFYLSDGSIYHYPAAIVDHGPSAAVVENRIGVLWNPTMKKMWVTINGVNPLGGDPLLGTGHAGNFTDVAGDLVPAISAYQSVMRVCTLPHELAHKPSYAQAWDGDSMILPSKYFRGVIARDTEITMGVHFAMPWGGGGSKGQPIGSLDVHNDDGYYDKLIDYIVRDEQVHFADRFQDRLMPIARGLADFLEFDDGRTLRVKVRGADAVLDKRVDEPALHLGSTNGLIPTTAVVGNQLIWDVGHTPYMTFEVLDKGLVIGQTWTDTARPARWDQAQGFRRTVAPAGKQMVRTVNTYHGRYVTYPLNWDFTSWGANPNNWTTTETPGTADILLPGGGSGVRFYRPTAVSTQAAVQQFVAPVAGSRYFALIDVAAYVQGDLVVYGTGGVPMAVGINGPGAYVIPLSGSVTGITLATIAVASAVDITVEAVQIITGVDISSRAGFVGHVLEVLGGLFSADYVLDTPSVASSNVGYWSASRPTLRQILDEALPSFLTDYYTDAYGRLTFVSLQEPALITPVGTLEEVQAMGPLSIDDDLAPALTDKFYAGYNWDRYSDTDLAGSVTAAQRALLTSEGTVQTFTGYNRFYQHAVGASPFRSLLTDAGNLLSRLFRQYGLYGKMKFWTRDYDVDEVRQYKPGDVVTLKATRYGLSTTGRSVEIISVTRRLLSKRVTIKTWG